ncbi:hypothetical protein ACFFRR_001178 [Megaselia abdita]
MSKRKHSVKHADSHNKSLFYDILRSEHSSSNSILYYCSKEENEYNVGKKIILDKFLNSVVIYENLCLNCARHLHDKSYDHLCNKCNVFDRDSISNTARESVSFEKNKSIFSGIIGSIKRIANGTPTSKKLDIIHNVDSVFKTNKTLDFNEICELKKESEQLEYMTNAVQYETSCKKTNTNQNFSEDKEFQTSNIVDWMTSLRTHICYYQLTDTENILNVKSIPSKKSFHFSCCSFPSDVTTSIQTSLNAIASFNFFSDIISNDSENSIEFNADVISEKYKNKIIKFKSNLMDSQTDLYHTHIKNVKLRSNKRHTINKNTKNIVGESSSSQQEHNESDSLQSTLDSNFSRQLGLCKSSNRNGFYGKHSSNSEFVNDILTVFDSFLNRDSQTHTSNCSIPLLPIRTFENTQTDTETSNCCNNVELSDSDKNKCVQKTVEWSSYMKSNFIFKDKFEKAPLYNFNELHINLWLDRSLNRIVIFYDNHLKTFLNNIDLKKKNLSIAQLVNFYLEWRHFSEKVKNKLNYHKINMTVPMLKPSTSSDSDGKHISSNTHEEENIYQPIWKFKTVGEAQHQNIDGRFCESPEYYDLLEDDEGEWEPADDISYHTYNLNLKHSDTIKSKQSTASAPPDIVHTNTSHKFNNDFRHKSISAENKDNKNVDIGFQYKTICILYSEISAINKHRAIIYDYKPFIHLPKIYTKNAIEFNQTQKSSKLQNAECCLNTHNLTLMDGRIDHIEVWKSCLYMEDEEDMYISIQEISRLNQQCDVSDSYSPRPYFSATPNSSLQRYKSISSGNLLDVEPIDKKTIAENLRDKLQKGLFKFNVRPRENKIRKNKGTNSLYLEESIFPIFGAKLNDLEKHFSFKHVPRFLVDAVDIIERIDNIQVDGIYRISGNKVEVDHLKKRLTISPYDKSCLNTDDVNTLTSLLKLFFRELKTPLIPEESYEQFPQNLLKPESLPLMKNIIDKIPAESKHTLKFLIKHLKM